jgi:hypothetical protein
VADQRPAPPGPIWISRIGVLPMSAQLRHRIVCVTKEGTRPHQHVVTIGLDTASHRWTSEQVRGQIAQGAQVVMPSESMGREVEVRPFDCSCGVATVRSYTASSDPDIDELEDFASCPPR